MDNTENIDIVIDLMKFLKENKINYSLGKIQFKGKRVGNFSKNIDNVYQLQIYTQFDDFFHELIDNEPISIKLFAEKQLTKNNCTRCLSGKCSVTNIKITEFDKELIAFANNLILLRRDAILKERVPKCNYVKLSERGNMLKCAKCKVCNPKCRELKNF